ncbi:DUF2004 domain-containing protein [Klebsiella oxytoca]|uniref:DUF2004 domain-containing protein n=1 Tax=Klebsiella oxytoca TaxID=571 RepID=A0A6B8N2R1_KLEOX|nr:DUF2004 domain-containing protein [Klebsiella oxytoca]QGN40137.1 DUF2004 domain-containing protein [Klebsiella oxytoca]
MAITLNTARWGTLNIDEDDGFAEIVMLTVNGKQRNVWLNIFEDVLPATPAAKIIALLDSVPTCEEQIQNMLVREAGENAFIDDFLEYVQEYDEETLQTLNITTPTRLICAKSLILRGVGIWLAAPAPGTLSMTLDYGLPEEFSDQLLVFDFDENSTLRDISWES